MNSFPFGFVSLAFVWVALVGPSGQPSGQPTGQPIGFAAVQGEEYSGGDLDTDDGLIGDASVHPLTLADIRETEQRDWPEELLLNVLRPELRSLAVFLARGPQSDFERAQAEFQGMLAPGASMGLVSDFPAESKASFDGVDRWESATVAPQAADVAAWVAALERNRAGIERVRYAVIEATRAQFNGDAESELALEFEYRSAALFENGGRRFDREQWKSVWRLDEDGWVIVELQPSERMRLECQDPPFVDISPAAMAGTYFDPRLPSRSPSQHPGRPGLAVADVDADGDLDLVVAAPLTLLLNDGDGHFEDASFMQFAKIDREGVSGVLIEDFDRDGDQDIFAAAIHTNRILLQGDDGEFTEHQLPSAENSARATAVARDVDGDGWLDVLCLSHGSLNRPGPSSADNADNGDLTRMYRGLGEGRFEDVTEAWGLSAEGRRFAFAADFADFDGDGDEDLYVANDFGPNILYWREDKPSGVFFRAEIEPLKEFDVGFSMGAFFADLDGDLDLDMYVTNMSSIAADRVLKHPSAPKVGSKLRRSMEMLARGNSVLLAEDGKFIQAPLEAGAVKAQWGWGTAVFDFDNDRDLDIGCVNGFLSKGTDDGRDISSLWWRYGVPAYGAAEGSIVSITGNLRRGWSWSGFDRNRFFVNSGSAQFRDLSEVYGLDHVADGRGLAAADIDGDGDLDLIATNLNYPPVAVLRNNLARDRHSAYFDLRAADNGSAVGAHIVLRDELGAQLRVVGAGTGFLTMQPLVQHFGLGSSDRIESLEIRWPNGEVQALHDLEVDRSYVIQQGEGVVSARGYEPVKKEPPAVWDPELDQPSIIRSARRVSLRGLPYVDEAGENINLVPGSAARLGSLLCLWSAQQPLTPEKFAELKLFDTREKGLMILPIQVQAEGPNEGELLPLVESSPVPSARISGGDREELDRALSAVRGDLPLELPLYLLVLRNGKVLAFSDGDIDCDSLEFFIDYLRKVEQASSGGRRRRSR